MESYHENLIVCNGKSPNSYDMAPKSSNSAHKKTAHTNLNWLLHIMYARKDFKFCKNLIEKQLLENCDLEYLYFVKGLIARDEGEYVNAVKHFQKSVELCPSNAEYYKEIGKTLFAMGKLKQSLEVFLKAVELQERPDSDVFFYIGELYYRNVGKPNGGIQVAKEYFQRAIQHGKQDVDSYRKLADIFAKENNYPKAIEMLESCLLVTPEATDILTEMGILHLKTNDADAAYEKLSRAVKLDGKSSKALIALGAVLQSKSDIDGALNRYKLIANLENECPEIWSNLGLCLLKKQKFIASISCLRKSQLISPLNFNVLYNLGLVLLNTDQVTSAFYTFAAAISLRPQQAECYMLLGLCLRKLKDPKNAYLAFERSAMLPEAIKNPLIYLNFAIFCYEIGVDEKSQLYVENFYKMGESVHVSKDYLKRADKLTELLGHRNANQMEDDGDMLQSAFNAGNEEDEFNNDNQEAGFKENEI